MPSLEVHYKLFGTDGVSLQSQELSKALSDRGWPVFACASDVPDGVEGLRLDELSYQSADAVDLRGRLFPGGGAAAGDGSALVDEVRDRAAPIRRRIEEYCDLHGVTVVHVRNLMSLPYNLPATVALFDLSRERRDLGFLMQHHDLYWEGPNARSFLTPYAEARALLDEVMCPRLPNAEHVLINPIAADALRERTGITGTVVPDGFDFDRVLPALDEDAFRRSLDVVSGDVQPLNSDDLIVSMPARIAINKAIELAIQFVAGLERRRDELVSASDGLGPDRRSLSSRSRIGLMLPQGEDMQDNRTYYDRLVAYAQHLQVTLAYGGDVVVPDRRFAPGTPDRYPFYGTYRTTDMVCYPPEHEGFGNQAIETVWARRPLAVLEYPVFQRFVKDHIPHYISLGDTSTLERIDEFGGLHKLRADVLETALDETVRLLTQPDLTQQWGEENSTALRALCGIDIVAATYLRLYGQLEGVARS